MQSLPNRPESPPGAFLPAKPNRRWAVRQKIHSPAYVSVDPCKDGTIFGLNEVLDIGVAGLSFQAPETLDSGSNVNLNLQLNAVKTSVQATGRVVWSDASGRTGVQLERDSLSSPDILDEYLFLNAITACTHFDGLHSVSGSPDPDDQNSETARALPLPPDQSADVESLDYPAVLTWLSEIKEEIEAWGASVDPPWQNIAERTLNFLQATGVAIAISSKEKMVCQASAGFAPGVGTKFESDAGFSGRCIRTGVLMWSDDAETDPRVDQEACSAMGIRSILAAPIRSDLGVTGLIEVFSDRPRAFKRNARILLHGLTEIVAAAQNNFYWDVAESDSDVPDLSHSPLDDSKHPLLPSRHDISDRLLASPRQRLQALATVVTFLIAATLLIPWIRTRANHTQQFRNDAQPAAFPLDTSAIPSTASSASELESLRRLAQAGDAYAQFALGARYATGEDVPQDYSSAAKWFARAADQGHVVAQATLGAYYWVGRGVPLDLRKAYFWSVLAQDGGDEGSKFRLASLASSMSRHEMVLAQQDANEWLRKHHFSTGTNPYRP
jgi:hypothetical protein